MDMLPLLIIPNALIIAVPEAEKKKFLVDFNVGSATQVSLAPEALLAKLAMLELTQIPLEVTAANLVPSVRFLEQKVHSVLIVRLAKSLQQIKVRAWRTALPALDRNSRTTHSPRAFRQEMSFSAPLVWTAFIAMQRPHLYAYSARQATSRLTTSKAASWTAKTKSQT